MLCLAPVAYANLTPAQKCEKLKNKAAGKRALCAAVERGKEIAGKPFDYAACASAMSTSFTQYETRAHGACPTTGDAAEVEARVDTVFNQNNALGKALSGVRFVDNGDGTVTDTQTGLMWEKKDNLDGAANYADPHDADNVYTWSATGPSYAAPSGTVFTDFLFKLNNCTSNGYDDAGGFAGHCDWRLPTRDELANILDPTAPGCATSGCPNGPCIDPVFGPTVVDSSPCGTFNTSYWTNATDSFYSYSALAIDFSQAIGGPSYSAQTKANPWSARAVRGQ